MINYYRILCRNLAPMALVLTASTLSAQPVDDSDILNSCSAENGKALYSKCAVCHNFDSSGNHGVVGPNLYQIVERKVGKVEGYKFSSTMRKSEDTWTVEHLDAFLKSPMAVYPRTRMAFGGINNPQDRADLICFMAANNPITN